MRPAATAEVHEAGRADGAPGGAGRWEALRTLVRARLVVASLALPVGVLLRPGVGEAAWPLLLVALAAVAALSALFWWAAGVRRWPRVQTYGQIAADLALVGGVSAFTGGRESQFVLFFALVVITGGVLARLPGGLFAAGGACVAFVALPWLAAAVGRPSEPGVAAALPRPELFVAFLAVVGVLAGILGERAGRTREDLERTARELDRVRVDNDVILRHLTSGVLTVNGAGRVAYLNPAGEAMLGLRGLEVRGRMLGEALPERLRPLRDVLADALSHGLPRARVEVALRTPDGRTLPAGLSTNPLVHDGAVEGVVAVFTDLTEVREMERRARRNETLAELGALAAGIAHELRNGLNPISGSAECLQRELRLEGENAVLMELIVKECARLNRFVTDLLAYSRERDLAPAAYDLDAQLGELREVFARDPRAGAGTVVAFEPGPDCGRVHADQEMLRQVWLNLAANALEAMPAGGRLVVRRRAEGRDRQVVEFVDTGTGIAAEDLPRVGQPFFTTKRGGTGLGLAIAQRIVERHGGALSLESTPGRGTIARVILPAAADERALAA
uniref:histidine kinase n=1 Tax=Eiseniibacteriota bacterium TaxID=2212470 RepID=A0A832I1Z1_UNCEI